jgi:hypothetical protein
MANAGRNRAQTFAGLSALAPLLVILMSFLMPHFAKGNCLVTLAACALTLPLVFAGSICGIVGLAMMARHGIKGVLVSAIMGLLLSGIITVGAIGSGIAAAVDMAHVQARSQAVDEFDAQLAQSQRLRSADIQVVAAGDFEGARRIERRTRKLIDKSKDIAAALPDNERALFKAVNACSARLGHVSKAKNEALIALTNAGGMDFSGLHSLQAVQERARLFRAARNATAQSLECARTYEADVRAACARHNAPAGYAEECLESMRDLLPVMILFLEADVEALDIGLELLAFLETNFGQWVVNSVTGELTYPISRESQAQFDAHRRRFDLAIQRSAKLQQQVLRKAQVP